MKLYFAAVGAAFACAQFMLAPATSLAQDGNVSADGAPVTITFEIAAARALNAAPAIKARAESRRAATAQLEQARLRLNPELGLEAENITGTGAFNGLGGGEYTVSLGQRFERGGKRRARIAVARGAQEVSRLEAERTRLDIIFETQTAYIDTMRAAAALANAEDRALLAQEFEAAVMRRVEAARDPAVAGQRTAVQVLEINADLDQARRNFDIAKRRLSSLWGEPIADFTINAGRFYEVPDEIAFPDYAIFDATPDLLLGAAAENSADAALAVERAKAKQDPTISLGLRRLQQSSDVAAIVSLSMPLAFFDANKGNVNRAMAERRRMTWEAEDARRRLQRAANMQIELFHAARSEALVVRNNIIPKAEAALASAQDGYSRGAFTYLDVLDAERSLKDLQTREISALFRLHTARAALDRFSARFQSPFAGEETQQ